MPHSISLLLPQADSLSRSLMLLHQQHNDRAWLMMEARFSLPSTLIEAKVADVDVSVACIVTHRPACGCSGMSQVSSGPSAVRAPAKLSGGKRPAHAQQELSATMRSVKARTSTPAPPMAVSKATPTDAEQSAEDADVSHKTVRSVGIASAC